MNEREMPYWKIAAVYDLLRHDNPASDFDPRIYDPDYDLKICKKVPRSSSKLARPTPSRRNGSAW